MSDRGGCFGIRVGVVVSDARVSVAVEVRIGLLVAVRVFVGVATGVGVSVGALIAVVGGDSVCMLVAEAASVIAGVSVGIAAEAT